MVPEARHARWFEKLGQAHSLPLTGHDEYEAETFFPMLAYARFPEPRATSYQGGPAARAERVTATRDAACSCGHLRLQVSGEPCSVSMCHCLSCQLRKELVASAV
jgi:hypothetical protein